MSSAASDSSRPPGDHALDGLRVVAPGTTMLAPVARRAVREFCRRHGATPEVCQAVAVAVTEAVANAVVHGYRDAQQPGLVEVATGVEDGQLVVAVRDFGAGVATWGRSRGAGLGLPLISMLADRVEVFEEAGGGTELRMSFDPQRP
jgi:anti-sigma regulatory factor (Ser/Thr protein kinase)